MNIKQILAGGLAAVMAGATMGVGAFGATLANYPGMFVGSDGTLDALFVVGAAAQPQDVIGAIDVSARLSGEATSTYVGSTGGGGATTSVDVTGEGKAVATTSTRIFLDDSLGKSGLRTSMTKDELPILLKNEVHTNTDGDHKYTQSIKLTPGSTTSASYTLQFEKPGSDSSVDPTYSFGRFPTSPTTSDYLYSYEVSFDTTVNLSSAKGETLRLGNEDFFVHADTTGDPAVDGNSNLLVLFKGQKLSLVGGESKDVMVNGKNYTVKLNGLTAASTASVGVTSPTSSDSQNIDKTKTRKLTDLEVFVSSTSQLSTTDQSQNKATLVVGDSDSKIQLGHGVKVKKGSLGTSVDGTLTNLTINSRKLSKVTYYVGAKGSNVGEDYLKLGGEFKDPVFAFKLAFPSLSTDLPEGAIATSVASAAGSTRNKIYIAGAGDNVMQVTFTDERSNEKTIDYSYKAAVTDTTAVLADASNNTIVNIENKSVAKDAYFTFEVGGVTRLFKLTGISVSQSATDSITLLDVFSGTSTAYTLGASDGNSFSIGGQTVYTYANTTHARFTWGTGAAINSTGTYTSVMSPIKGKNGESLFFAQGTAGNPLVDAMQLNAFEFLVNRTFINLPTGAINITIDTAVVSTKLLNITAVAKEDGTASALSSTVSVNLSAMGLAGTGSTQFTLGRTATGGLIYNLTLLGNPNVSTQAIVSVVGSTAGNPLTNASLGIVQEKDDAGNQYSIVVPSGMEASGSNQQIIPGTSDWTETEDSASGKTSTETKYAGLWGTFAKLTTSGRDTLTLWYPNEQASANVFVLAKDASVSSVASSAAVSASSAVPTSLKQKVAKADTDLSAADKTTKNLIVVGGPAVNTIAADLLGKTFPSYGEASGIAKNTALIQLFENKYATGKSVLLVAGWEAANTGVATSVLQQYDTAANKAKLTGSKVVLDAQGAVVVAAAPTTPAAS